MRSVVRLSITAILSGYLRADSARTVASDNWVMLSLLRHAFLALRTLRWSCQVASDLGVPAEQVAGDDQTLHLIGTFIDTHKSHLAVPPFDRKLAGVSHPAMDLHDPVDHVVDHLGAVELGHG